MLATLGPMDAILRNDYVTPPIKKRLKDVETILLPPGLFKDLPPFKRLVKARRLKVVSEAFDQEETSLLKQLRNDLY